MLDSDAVEGQFRVGTWVSGLRQQEINCKDTWPRLSEGAQPRRQDPSIKRDCPMPRGSAIVDCYENDLADSITLCGRKQAER